MSTNLIQVSIYTVSPGNHLALSRILMYFLKVLVFSNKLRVIMQMFVHFQEKRPFSQLTFAKNMGKTGMLVEEFYLRSAMNASASKFKCRWWTYFPCIFLVHLEVMFKMSGDFLLPCGKWDSTSMCQQTLEYPGLKLSSENWCFLQERERALKTGLINLVESGVRFTLTVFSLA